MTREREWWADEVYDPSPYPPRPRIMSDLSNLVIASKSLGNAFAGTFVGLNNFITTTPPPVSIGAKETRLQKPAHSMTPVGGRVYDRRGRKRY